MKSYFSVIFVWIVSFIFGNEFITYLKYNFQTTMMSGTLKWKMRTRHFAMILK